MKPVLPRVLRLLFCLSCLVLAASARARTSVIVWDPSSFADGAGSFEHFKKTLYDTNTPPGTRVYYVVSLGSRFETPGDLTIPRLPIDGARARQYAFARGVAEARSKIAALGRVRPDGSGVLLPGLLAHLRSLGLASDELSVLIVGSPFVTNAEPPRLDLMRWYPLDTVMDLPPETSRLGMAHLRSAFKSLAVSWQIPEVNLPVESQRRLQRYLALAVARAGGSLVNWTTDPVAASASFVNPAAYTAEAFTLRAGEPARLRPYLAKALSTCGLDPALVAAIEELKKAGVRRCIAASWQVDADVDVHVSCSAQFPGEKEVFFGRTNSPHLRFLGDLRKATGKGFEIVALDDAVMPDKLTVWLELFRASQPTSGEIVYYSDGSLYRSTFAFGPDDRGDQGLYREARAGAPNWVLVRMADLLKQSVDE